MLAAGSYSPCDCHLRMLSSIGRPLLRMGHGSGHNATLSDELLLLLHLLLLPLLHLLLLPLLILIGMCC